MYKGVSKNSFPINFHDLEAARFCNGHGDMPSIFRYFPILFFFLSVSVSFASINDSLDLEKIPAYAFQDQVVHFERAKKDCITLANGIHKGFACAAAYYYEGNNDSAYKAYHSLLGKDSALDKSILIRMSRVLFAEKKFKKARKTLLDGKGRFGKDPEWEEGCSRLRLELTLADPKIKPKAQADSVEAFLKKYGDDERVPMLRFRKAKLLESAGRYKLAMQAYRYVLSNPSDYGDSALASLRALRVKVPLNETLDEKIIYTKCICARGLHAECLALLDTIASIDSSKAPVRDTTKPPVLKTAEDSTVWRLSPSSLPLKTRIQLWERRARAYKGMENDTSAIKVYSFLLDSVELRPRWLQSLIRLYRAENRTDDAKRIDSIFQDKFRYSPENANNIWVRGLEYEQNKNYPLAIATYDSLTDPRFSGSSKSEWAKFRIGFIYYKMNNLDSAAIVFEMAKKLPFVWSSSASRMFLGDIYKAQRKDSLARDAYLDCIRDFPVGYYAHRSRVKLVENKLMDSLKVPWLAPQDLSDSATLVWIRSFQPGSKPDSSYSAGRFEQVKHLLDWGFTEEAFDLFEEANKKNSKRLDFLYEYGTLFLRYGEIIKGYNLSRNFQNIIDRKHLGEAPRNVLRFLYPIPYSRRVVLASGEGIDPFFVYGVMRQESTFNFLITSRAGARGLLQIMPATGKKLAKAENIADFTPAQLYNPFMNIRLGVRYLKDLLNEYNRDPMYVLCNYNAGPKPAKRWQTATEGLPWDVRAEEISYWETRDYVKRVLGNYWVYAEVWNRIGE